MKPNIKHAETAWLPAPDCGALFPSNAMGEGNAAEPAVTGNLPGVQARCLVHADGSQIKVSFDIDHSCAFVFQLSESSEQGPDPIAALVADVIDQVWSLAFAKGTEQSRAKVLAAFQTNS